MREKVAEILYNKRNDLNEDSNFHTSMKKGYYLELADAAIAAIFAELETPSVEMVESVARVYNQTRCGAAINLSGETVYRPTAHDAMTAALQAAAAHLRKAS